MVRLKLYDYLTEQGIKIESQFHYGSIKTMSNVINLSEKLGLNSTMVRLKQFQEGEFSFLELSLNSTMVRLKL
mgnify:CR=1 FL=1